MLPLSAGRVWQVTLYWVFLALNPQFLANDARLCEHDFPLYPKLLPVTLCYITPFNLPDGHFPVHHPSSPLLFLSPLSPALLCTPPCLTPLSCPSSSVPPSVHPSIASVLSPADCFNVNFTLLMLITSVTVCVFSQGFMSICTAKPLNNSLDFYTCITGEKSPRTVF